MMFKDNIAPWYISDLYNLTPLSWRTLLLLDISIPRSPWTIFLFDTVDELSSMLTDNISLGLWYENCLPLADSFSR